MKNVPLSLCVRSGDLLFLSGQLAFDEQMKLVAGPVAAQTRRCLENIGAILAKEGASKDDVLKVTVWLTAAADFAEFNAAYAAFFAGHKPARSTVVAALVVRGALVEIEVIARAPIDRRGGRINAQMRVQANELLSLVTRIFVAGGSASGEASAVAGHLVDSDLAGHPSHGVGLVPMYIDHLRRGYVKANRTPRLCRDRGTVLGFDACGGYGKPAADALMRTAIDRCREHGVCVATLGNGHHLGRLGAFGEDAARAGLISIHFANVIGMDPLVAPFGGIEAKLSTNPVCIAVPGTAECPVLLFDASTSAIAMNKVRVALQGGRKLPRDAAIDAEGRPASDPSVMFSKPRGALLPMGQHKGYALAFMCELLAGTLSGAGAMPTPPRDGSGMVNNLLSLLFDPERWDATDELRREAEALIVYLHGTTPVDREKPVLVPGEPERDARRDNEALGIPLPEATLAALMALAR